MISAANSSDCDFNEVVSGYFRISLWVFYHRIQQGSRSQYCAQQWLKKPKAETQSATRRIQTRRSKSCSSCQLFCPLPHRRRFLPDPEWRHMVSLQPFVKKVIPSWLFSIKIVNLWITILLALMLQPTRFLNCGNKGVLNLLKLIYCSICYKIQLLKVSLYWRNSNNKELFDRL